MWDGILSYCEVSKNEMDEILFWKSILDIWNLY